MACEESDSSEAKDDNGKTNNDDDEYTPAPKRAKTEDTTEATVKEE